MIICVSSYCARSLLLFVSLLDSLPDPVLGHVPWIVALAPMAVSAPNVPTMKYWNTRFDSSSLALLYLLKSGMLVVARAVPPLRWKGLSNDEFCEASFAWCRVCTPLVAAMLFVGDDEEEVEGIRAVVGWVRMTAGSV